MKQRNLGVSSFIWKKFWLLYFRQTNYLMGEKLDTAYNSFLTVFQNYRKMPLAFKASRCQTLQGLTTYPLKSTVH